MGDGPSVSRRNRVAFAEGLLNQHAGTSTAAASHSGQTLPGEDCADGCDSANAVSVAGEGGPSEGATQEHRKDGVEENNKASACRLHSQLGRC